MKKFLALIMAALMAVTMLASCGAAAEKVKVIDIKLTDEDYAFAVNKGQPELLEKVNAFLAKIQENGKFDEICKKYFSGEGEITPVTSAAKDPNKEQLVVATNAAFAPFEYMDGDKFVGIDMEIAALLAEDLGMELVIDNMDFDAVLTSVQSGTCDMGMAGLTVTEERMLTVDFSTPYYKASQKLIVRESDTTFDECKTVEDVEKILNGYDDKTTIGVQQGTTGNLYVAGNEDWGFPGFKVTCKPYDNGTLAVTDLGNKNINFVIIDEAPASFIVDSYNKTVG